MLSLHPRGFGFVAVEDSEDEVFVPAKARGAAMHRDRVEVEVEDSARGPLGTVVRVLRRGMREIGGTLRRQDGDLGLHPGDPRLPARLAVHGRLPRGVRPGRAVIAEVDSEGRIRARVTPADAQLGPDGTLEGVLVAAKAVREGTK